MIRLEESKNMEAAEKLKLEEEIRFKQEEVSFKSFIIHLTHSTYIM